MLNQPFIQDDFNPEDIVPFRALPMMSQAVFQTMLPDKEGKFYAANLREGIFGTYFTYFNKILYLHFMHIILVILRTQRNDGDQSKEFYWIDPMMSAEKMAAKPTYYGQGFSRQE